MENLDKLDRLMFKVLFYACAILMFSMAAVVSAQVLSRYIIGRPFTWSEELARYIFVWMSFLGMAIGIKQGSHVALDILQKKLTGVSKKILILLNNFLVFFFGVSLSISGFKLFELGMRQNSPTLQLPMQYVYIVIPISGIIVVYFVVSETIRALKDDFSTGKEDLA